MPWAAIGAVAAPVISGIMGSNAAQGQLNAANAARQQALAAYSGINVPSISDQQLSLNHEQVQGTMDPALQQAIQQQQSQLAGYQKNPDAVAAQTAALKQLQQLGQSGLTPSDVAEMQQLTNKTGAQNQAQQKQIMQNLAARGMGGSGAELAARLSANQSSAANANNATNQLQQMALQRQLQAITQGANLGQSMESQNYGEASNTAAMQNAINQFNAQQKAASQNYNVSAQNQAQQQNLANKQNVANTNVGLTNQQQQFNKGLYQTQFGNEMQKAGGQSGQLNNIAAGNQQQAANTANMYSGIGQGVGTGLAGIANNQNQQNMADSNAFANAFK